MKINQSYIADRLGISVAHISQIFSGLYEPGKATCRKFERFTGIPWTSFLSMNPNQIKEALFKAAHDKNKEGANGG